jgi:hypothetical protein
VFGAIGGRQHRLRFHHAPVPAGDPRPDEEGVPGGDVPPETHAQFGGERLAPGGGDGLGHRFVEDRADDAPMHDPAKALP